MVAEEYANFNRESAKQAMTRLLESRSTELPFDLVFAFNDEMAVGVYDAYEEAGLNDKPFILGIDALPSNRGSGSISDILNGKIDASFIYPTGGNEVIDLARRILMKVSYEKENLLNTELVNSSNIRVYQMQLNQMLEKQRRVEDLNSKIKASTTMYKNQQIMNYILICLAVVLTFLLIALALSSRTKTRLFKQLNKQNIRIQKQVDSLETQKKQLIGLSEQLEETTHAKLLFFTNISHEFKTPLSLICGPIDDLLSNKDMPQNALSSLDILKRNSSKLTRLITELLDFRTYENGKVNLKYSMGNLDPFLQDIVKMFSDVIKRRNLTFTYEVDESDYEMPFDPVKMEKVFTNLLSNAFNHVNREGCIRIKLFSTNKEQRRYVNLSVYNSGSYIPPENIDKIYQRFYTLDAQQKGTGIGLALVSSIVDALGGTIDVVSDKSEGTEFTVRIPIDPTLRIENKIDKDTYIPEFARLKLATMQEEDANEGIFDETSNKGEKQTVLVIEDNTDMRYYLKNILSSDYHVILAKDGNIGLTKAIKFVPNIILCDILMPGIDGFQVCTALRGNRATKSIPIILLTACSLEEQKTKGYESGADAFMQKPFSVTTLKVRIKTLLDKSREISSAINGDWLVGRDASALSSESVEILNKLREYVEEHILDDISLDDLAQYLCYSKSKLYRELKDVTEYTPIDLVNLVRLRKAVDLMTNEHQNITEAAFNTGFSSSSYFSRAFMKYYHMRPKEYLQSRQSI